MSERALFFNLAAERLRSRARWGAIILVLSLVLPYEVVDGSPQWIFGILRELPVAAVIAAFAPVLAGTGILVARALCTRATSLAIAIVAILATAAVVIKIGADAAAWDVLRLPTSFAERPTPAIVGLSLAGAGANLTFKAHARRDARVLLIAAFLVIAGYYAWPARGEAPLTTVVRALAQIGELPSVRFQIGLAMVAFFALFPLIAVSIALVHLKVPARGEQSIAGLVATLGLPALIGFLLYRAMLTATASVEVIATAAGAALLLALLSLITASIEVIVDGRHADESIELPPGATPQRAAIHAVAAALVVIAVQGLLARPPKKGVDWALNEPSADGEKLFREKIPAWSYARAAWDASVRRESSAEEMLRVKSAAREMNALARAVDGGLATALEELTREADSLDVAGRRWVRLVAQVNDASRRARVPFYLDPTVHIFQTKDGLRRTFRVTSYRVEAVHPVHVGGAPFATLHVRALAGSHGHGSLLGFSRDLDPFALVELREIESSEDSYREAASKDEPVCGVAPNAEAYRAMRKCGDTLRALATDKLRDHLVTMTERHELQHQIDGPHLSMSTHVLRRLTGYSDDARARANRELSAYLAELTSSAPPKLGIVHLVPFALIARGGAEHHVAVITISALTKRTVPLAERGDGVDYETLTTAIDELFAMDDDTLRTRAREVWREAFGRALPEPTP